MLTLADESGNVAAACRAVGVWRASSWWWKALGRRNQRLAALAETTAITDGRWSIELRTTRSGSAASPPHPAIWSRWTPSMSAKLKGVGRGWQFTAVDTHTRWAVVDLAIGDKTAAAAPAFLDLLANRLGGLDIDVTGILRGHGPDFRQRFRGQQRSWMPATLSKTSRHLVA